MTTQYDLFDSPVSIEQKHKSTRAANVTARLAPVVEPDLFADEKCDIVAFEENQQSLQQEVSEVTVNLVDEPTNHEHLECLVKQRDALQTAKDHSKKFLLPDVNINEAFSALVILRVEQYLADLEGVEGLPTYDMIVSAAERPLLKWAMDKAGGKQLAAAKILGINRNTLRKKLRMHGFLEGDFE